MSVVALLVWCVAALLATAVLAMALGRSGRATGVIYGATLAASVVALANTLMRLVGDAGTAQSLSLPLGLPWLGAHFRLDALAAFFLLVVNLGARPRGLYGLGYGRHEPAPHRVLPFFAAFLAGMNLVVLADDAFTFLVSWEFMSLAHGRLSWRTTRARDNTRAAYVYLVMASFGTLALLLAFGLLSGPDGGYAFEAIRASSHTPMIAAVHARTDAARRRIKGRARAASCLAAARPPPPRRATSRR